MHPDTANRRQPTPASDAELVAADKVLDRLRRLPRPVLVWVLHKVDAFYLAFQSALKMFGMVPMSGDPPREIADAVGGRWAILPARDGRWRELRVPLPETAVHWFSLESMFRRGEVWRAFESFEDIVDRYMTLLEGWKKSGSQDRRIVFKAVDAGIGVLDQARAAPGWRRDRLDRSARWLDDPATVADA